MKKNILILSFFFMFCANIVLAQNPPGFDKRCNDYLVEFCRDILSQGQKEQCVQWEGKCGLDAHISRAGGVMIGAHILDEKSQLAVTGGIISTSLRVAIDRWPDYVFDKTYTLMPLADMKTFIKDNKRLPNTPSASEVEKQGGFNVGEVFVNHQEKIEEIFLHLISLKKEATALQKEEGDLDIEQIELMLALSDKIAQIIKK
jgi:hypothetical protein